MAKPPQNAELEEKRIAHRQQTQEQNPPVETRDPFSPGEQDALLWGPDGIFGRGSLDYQTARLSDPHLDEGTRQYLLEQIGEVQGNQHLLTVLAAMTPSPPPIEASPTPAEEPADPSLQTPAAETHNNLPPVTAGTPAATTSTEPLTEEGTELAGELEGDLAAAGPPSLAGAPPPSPNGTGVFEPGKTAAPDPARIETNTVDPFAGPDEALFTANAGDYEVGEMGRKNAAGTEDAATGWLADALDELAATPLPQMGPVIDRINSTTPQMQTAASEALDAQIPPQINTPLGVPTREEVTGEADLPAPEDIQEEARGLAADALPEPTLIEEAAGNRLLQDPQQEAHIYREQREAGAENTASEETAAQIENQPPPAGVGPAEPQTPDSQSAGPRPKLDLTHQSAGQELTQQQNAAQEQMNTQALESRSVLDADYGQQTLLPTEPVDSLPLERGLEPAEPPPTLQPLAQRAELSAKSPQKEDDADTDDAG